MARSRRNRPEREAKESTPKKNGRPAPKPAPPKEEPKPKGPERVKTKGKGKAAEERLTCHPVCLAIPKHDEPTLEGLTASIREVGLTDPIVLLDGQILDGRGRYECCLRAKVTPRFVDWRSLPESAVMTPLDFVLARNVHRRDLGDAGRTEAFRNVLTMEPSRPDSFFADHFRMAPATVKKMRAELDATGEVPDPGYRTMEDGTTRPARYEKHKEDDKRKKKPESYPEPPPDAGDSWEPGADEEADRAAADAHKAEFTESGARVPAHLADIFGDPFYKDAADVMRRWTRHVKSRPDAYLRLLNGRAFLNHLQNAIKALEFASPYSVCEECDGTGTTGNGGCSECATTGWVSQGEAEAKEFTE